MNAYQAWVLDEDASKPRILLRGEKLITLLLSVSSDAAGLKESQLYPHCFAKTFPCMWQLWDIRSYTYS